MIINTPLLSFSRQFILIPWFIEPNFQLQHAVENASRPGDYMSDLSAKEDFPILIQRTREQETNETSKKGGAANFTRMRNGSCL